MSLNLFSFVIQFNEKSNRERQSFPIPKYASFDWNISISIIKAVDNNVFSELLLWHNWKNESFPDLSKSYDA